jgi:hypothetical protein
VYSEESIELLDHSAYRPQSTSPDAAQLLLSDRNCTVKVNAIVHPVEVANDAMDRCDRIRGSDPRGTWHLVVISRFNRAHELEVLAGRPLIMVRGVCLRSGVAHFTLVSATSVTTQTGPRERPLMTAPQCSTYHVQSIGRFTVDPLTHFGAAG